MTSSVDKITACWGFWTKENRNEIKEYAKEHKILLEMHYIDIDDKTWYENIQINLCSL